ncbi:MAG: hypothetical protein M3O70_28390, partial [Actinomycetota bacterium]|nr:hypothetical protein [Actinomycetota bacterium]
AATADADDLDHGEIVLRDRRHPTLLFSRYRGCRSGRGSPGALPCPHLRLARSGPTAGVDTALGEVVMLMHSVSFPVAADSPPRPPTDCIRTDR